MISENFYIRLFEALERENVRYLVVGGLAIVLYGAPRLTVDVDIIIDFSLENVKNLSKAFSRLKLTPSVPVDLIEIANPERRESLWKEKNMYALNFRNIDSPAESVDVLIKKPIDFNEAFERKRVFEISGVRINVASPDDIIQMKRKSHRDKDIADIETLEELKDEEAF